MVFMPNLPPKPLYPIEAEQPIIDAFTQTNRAHWIAVSPTAIATTALTALREAGWRLLPPAPRADPQEPQSGIGKSTSVSDKDEAEWEPVP